LYTGTTDDECEVEIVPSKAEIQGWDCRPASFKVNQKLTMTTQDQIAHAQRELVLEEKREEEYKMAAIQSKNKCDSWLKRIEELKKQLEIEVTDAAVIQGISSSLGPEDYLTHGSRVPQVFLTIFENWTSSNLPWDEYWKAFQSNLRDISITALKTSDTTQEYTQSNLVDFTSAEEAPGGCKTYLEIY